MDQITNYERYAEHHHSREEAERNSSEREEWDEVDEATAETALTSQQETAYADIYTAVRSGFRAGLDLKDVQKAINEALPWKIN